MRLTLNISPCPNDTFMFDALLNGRIDTRGLEFDVHFADIEELNSSVIDNGPDISKISYAVLPAIRERYLLLDSGSALGHGNGPLLVCRDSSASTAFISKIARSHTLSMLHIADDSRRESLSVETTDFPSPPHPVGMRPLRVAVPGIHTTANLLLQRLFPRLTDRTPVLFSEIAPAVARGDFDAGVLIHEGRFTYRDHGLQLMADLGEEWDRATGGLPLPLGAIVASRTLPPDVVKTFEELLRRSIEYAFANPGASRDFVKSHAQEMDDTVIDSHIALFVNEYSLSLGPQGRRAVKEITNYEL